MLAEEDLEEEMVVVVLEDEDLEDHGKLITLVCNFKCK
jgi:hypothetical protein